MVQDKAKQFYDLHHQGYPFILPNAWDAGSAKLIARAGFPAVATSSAGIAFSHGLPDGNNLSPDLMFGAVERIVQSVDVPVTMDMESGYGDIGATIERIFEIGAVGANLEDADGESPEDLFSLEKAVKAIETAKEAISGRTFVLNARCDAYLTNQPKAFDVAMERGQLYAKAGADCVFIPGVVDQKEIAALVKMIQIPVNILGGVSAQPLSYKDFKALGVHRISTGGSLMRATYAQLERTLGVLDQEGSFTYAKDAIPDATMNAWMAK